MTWCLFYIYAYTVKEIDFYTLKKISLNQQYFLQLKEIFSLTEYQINVSLIQRNCFLGVSVKIKNHLLKNILRIFFLFEIFGRRYIFFNQKSKLHLKSKNFVTLWKCISYLQYYKIDSSFNIKLQEINLYRI